MESTHQNDIQEQHISGCTVSTQSGFATLFVVVVVSAAVLIMAYSASILGLGELEMGYTSQKGAEAFAIADGCIEESLRRFRIDPLYTGETLTTSNGSCIIQVDAVGNTRTVTVVANTTDAYYKKIETQITLSADAFPVVTIDSWEEKND